VQIQMREDEKQSHTVMVAETMGGPNQKSPPSQKSQRDGGGGCGGACAGVSWMGDAVKSHGQH
jgi:hypothetical protein